MQPQINRSFIRGFDQLLLEKGVQPAIFYQQANITPSHFHQNSHPISFYSELRLFEMAAKYFSEPDICLKLAERQSLSALGPAVSHLATGCNVLEAIYTLQENLHLSVEGVLLELNVSDNIATWTIKWTESALAANPYAQDHALALMYMIMKTFCGDQWKPRAVYFEHPEGHNLTNFHRYFAAPIAFNNGFTGLAFDPACLKKITNLRVPAESFNSPKIDTDRRERNLSDQIKSVIALLINNDDCCIEKVAEHLALSKRTLQRRLHEDQTSFKGLVNSVRREQAIELLHNSHFSLAEIGIMLGYAQLSAFSRSFKRWYGISPQAWRKENRV